MLNIKNKKLLIYNQRVSVLSRTAMNAASLLTAILAVIFYQSSDKGYCQHTKKLDLEMDIYMALRVLISLFVLCILLIYVINWLNSTKIYKNNEYIKIYKKYKDLFFRDAIKNSIIKQKWFCKAMSQYGRHEARIEKFFIFFALLNFFIELVTFITFTSDYFSRYIDSDFYLFIKTPKNKLTGYGLFLLSFLCVTYLYQVVYRFFSVLNLINKNYEINCFDKILTNSENENNIIYKLISAISQEKKKEFKIARLYFLITTLPVFIMASLIFTLKLVQYFIPKQKYSLQLLSKASLIIVIVYYIVRLLVFPLHHYCSKNYKVDCGDIFNVQFVKVCKKSTEEADQNKTDKLSGTLDVDNLTQQDIIKDALTLKGYGVEWGV